MDFPLAALGGSHGVGEVAAFPACGLYVVPLLYRSGRQLLLHGLLDVHGNLEGVPGPRVDREFYPFLRPGYQNNSMPKQFKKVVGI